MKGNVLVPAAPFARIIEERLEQNILADVDDPVSTIASQVGVTARVIYSIKSGQKSLEFDTADRIVTYLVGPMAWHEDDELHQIYMGADLNRLDWAAPPSEEVRAHQVRQAQELLDELMSMKDTAERLKIPIRTLRGALPPRPQGSYLRPICPKGHDKRIVGVTNCNSCAQCKRDKAKTDALHDPTIPHPGRVFYGGAWRKPDYIERHRARNRKAA